MYRATSPDPWDNGVSWKIEFDEWTHSNINNESNPHLPVDDASDITLPAGIHPLVVIDETNDIHSLNDTEAGADNLVIHQQQIEIIPRYIPESMNIDIASNATNTGESE